MERRDRDQIMQEVDRVTAQGKMSQSEAVEFLEELSADIDSRIEALKEEMED